MADDYQSLEEQNQAGAEREKAMGRELQGTRNRERIERLRSDDPAARGVAAHFIGKDKAEGVYSKRQSKRTRAGQDLDRRKKAGQPLSRLERLGLSRRRKAEGKRQTASKDLLGKLADPENPPTMRTFFVFGIFAFLQDFIPLLFDFVGVGFLIGYIMLPMTWGVYIYLIVRRLPRALVPKFLMRTALITAVSVIPVVGELLPEWIATAVGGYMELNRYQKGKSGLGGAVADKASDAAGEKAGKVIQFPGSDQSDQPARRAA